MLSIKKVGREQLCSLNAKTLQEVYQWVSFYEQFWEDKLGDLENYLKSNSEDSL